MKKYLMNDLIKMNVDLGEKPEKPDKIFFTMLDFIKKNEQVSSFISYNELKSILLDNTYYIAHKDITYKGKNAIFTGCLYMASKENILSFSLNNIIKDESRSFLIAPIFDNTPRFVLLTYEGVFYMYS